MDQKFFLQSFAFAGDKTAIPDPLQPGGTVSFNQGFGFDYERELGVDPLAKATPRQEMNYLLNAITDNVGVWQRYTFPEWITAANNDGAAYPYARGTIVRYRASGGDPFGYFISRVDTNVATPALGANWAPYIFEAATNAEALAGVSASVFMTPQRVAEAIAASAVTIPDATETVKGKVELATVAEANAGADTTRAVTAQGVHAAINTLVPAATTAVVGKARLATTAEANAGALATVAVTPAGLTTAVPGLVPAATTTVAGKVELATEAEAVTGTDTTRAVTCNGVTDAINNLVPAATTAVVGKTRLASVAEAGGVLATVAVTPAGLSPLLAAKAPLASPALTGVPTAPTAAVNTNTTQLATTAFVRANDDPAKANLAGAAFTGAVSSTATVTASGGFLGTSTVAILASGAAGTVYLRPNGVASATGQTTVSSTGAMAVAGVLTATGGFGPVSSRHLKDFSAEPLGYNLATFESIRVGRGKYKPQFNDDGRERLFFEAEQLATIIPEAELPGAADIEGVLYPGVDHSQLLPAMVAALAEASREIRALQARVAILENEG